MTERPPILDHKTHPEPSVFDPKALLREARRQKNLAALDVPAVCILDPDGDIVRHLNAAGKAHRFAAWPCYHTALHTFELAEETVGIIGHAVGAPFAVLVAEELFACGCSFLLSLTSAGQIEALAPPPYFVVIDRALRDEGTSYHYAPPCEFAEAHPQLVAVAIDALQREGLQVFAGRAGQPMRRFGKRPRPSRAPGRWASSPSKWKRRRSTLSRGRATRQCCVWPMSPTRWGKDGKISKKVKPTERRTHSRSCRSSSRPFVPGQRGLRTLDRDGSTCSNLDLAGLSSSASLQPASPSWPIRSPTCGPL